MYAQVGRGGKGASRFELTTPPPPPCRWTLRFELTIGPAFTFTSADRAFRAAQTLEQLVWSLPLPVQAPSAQGAS